MCRGFGFWSIESIMQGHQQIYTKRREIPSGFSSCDVFEYFHAVVIPECILFSAFQADVVWIIFQFARPFVQATKQHTQHTLCNNQNCPSASNQAQF